MAGSYDANKDYAAAIKKETDPAKKQQLINERQNKIDAMNAAGTNKNNYSNDIYNGGSSSGGNKNNSSGNKNSGGYYNPGMDYAAAIRNETDPVKKQQLIAERENKINAMNAAGTNTGGYTNSIYNGGGNNAPSKESYGYFDDGKDYAAAINAETDPVKKAQLIQERQNKLNWMNASGQNQNGYSNSIYGGTASSFGSQPVEKGIYQDQDAMINNAAMNNQMQTLSNQALANMQQDGAMQIDPVATIDYQNVLSQTTDPAQRAALQAYFTRLQSNIDPNDVQGVYAGDTSMSLPDQALMATYQKNLADAQARGDAAAVNLANKAIENLKDNYRYYPLANSNGYGLGENDLGWIRDIVVRVDSLGNKYVDEYGLNNVTTTRFNADGSQSWKNVSKIGAHDDYVARQMDRAAEYGRPENWTAIRVADAADAANLSGAELMAKYGATGGEGRDLYGSARINGKIANGMTGAGTPIGQKGATDAVANNGNSGYFDPDKDYAAAIKNATSTAEMLQLQQERENKLNWMNQNGQNPNGYTNQIYSNYQNIQSAPQGQQMMPQMAMPQYQGMTKEELYEGYNDAAANLESQRKALLNLTLQQSQAAQDTANAEYDDMARQAYILKRQQEMAMPQQLAALGISGGGSETANLKLQTNYQNNLNSNEVARQQMMKEYALQNLAAQTQANSDIAGYYADAQQNAMNAWQNEMANQNSWNQWAANYQQGLREYQDQLNNLTYEQLQANKQQQIDLALQLGDYNKLKALGYDTSYVQRLQDAELEQLALAAAKARNSGGGAPKAAPKEYPEVQQTSIDDLPTGNEMGDGWIMVSGLGKVTDDEVTAMVNSGELKKIAHNGMKYYMKA